MDDILGSQELILNNQLKGNNGNNNSSNQLNGIPISTQSMELLMKEIISLKETIHDLQYKEKVYIVEREKMKKNLQRAKEIIIEQRKKIFVQNNQNNNNNNQINYSNIENENIVYKPNRPLSQSSSQIEIDVYNNNSNNNKNQKSTSLPGSTLIRSLSSPLLYYSPPPISAFISSLMPTDYISSPSYYDQRNISNQPSPQQQSKERIICDSQKLKIKRLKEKKREFKDTISTLQKEKDSMEEMNKFYKNRIEYLEKVKGIQIIISPKLKSASSFKMSPRLQSLNNNSQPNSSKTSLEIVVL